MNDFLQPIFLLCALGFHATVADEIYVYAQIGEDVSLDLPYESNKYLKWYFNSKEIAWHNPLGGKHTIPEYGTRLTVSSRSLLIKNVTQTNFGQFRCIVRNKQQEQVDEIVFRLIQLNVAVDPAVCLPGEELSLTCDIENQGHTPQIHWVSPQGQTIEGNRGRLTVQATHLHSGQWTCVITNAGKEGKKVEKKVTVIGLKSPAPDAVPIEYTSPWSPLSVPCSLAADTTWDQVKSKGVVEVGWNFCPHKPPCNKTSLVQLSLEDHKPTWRTLTERALQPSPSPSTRDLSLGRKQAREGDGGDYECFVKFQNGVTLNRNVRVEVLQITATPGTQLRPGQQLNLTCTTGHPLPSDVQIQWFPPTPSPSSPPSSLFRSSNLWLKEVGSGDNGTWRCELRRGGTLLTWAVLVVNIEPQSSVWMLVTLCSAAAILILLVILMVILQRRRQRRTRRHMRLCHCKNPKPKGFYRS